MGARGGNAGNFASRPVPLILGSASPARKALLQAAGIEPLVVVSQVDEEQVLTDLWAQQERPADLHEVARIQVCALAQAKVEAVGATVLQALNLESSTLEAPTLAIVACDSMLEIGGKVVGKPHTPEIARERWQRMSGQQGVLWTGHALIRLDQQTANTFHAAPPVVGAQSTVVHFGELTPTEIAAYVATGEPLKVAGAFTLDGIGGPFIEGVRGIRTRWSASRSPSCANCSTESGFPSRNCGILQVHSPATHLPPRILSIPKSFHQQKVK